MSVIMLTTAPAGSGKTYRRCAHFLVSEFLPDRPGVHWSNFPVFRERVADEVARRKRCDRQDILDRIQIIPEDVLKAWMRGESGPWDYFRDVSLQDAHVAIDEVHNYCGRNTKPEVRRKWQEWLGEIRHRGATIEFISQAPEKIAREIEYEAEVRLSLVNSEVRRDPWFKILLGDWYELRAGYITGEYRSAVWEFELRKVHGKWVESDKRVFWFDPYYYQFYDSYSAPQKGGVKAEGKKREFERRSRVGLLWWFLKRNMFRIAGRACVVAGLVWFFNGGGGVVFGHIQQTVAGSMTVAPASVVKESDEPGEIQSPPVRVAESVVVSEPVRQVVAPSVSSDRRLDRRLEADSRVDDADRRRLEQIRAELEAAKAEIARLRDREAKSSGVVMLLDNGAVLRDGYFYAVGDLITWGPAEGRRIERIDIRRRWVVLDDGTIIRMAVDMPIGTVADGVPDAVRAGGTAPGPAGGVR